LGMWAIAVLFFVRRRAVHKTIRTVIFPPGLAIGWSDDKYAVNSEEVEALVRDLEMRVQAKYPCVSSALQDCLVFFTEPTWTMQTNTFIARKVAGFQDGKYIVVGWHADLKASALQHELLHRVMQRCGGELSEEEAHRIMASMGF
jgi:hypothetical protein